MMPGYEENSLEHILAIELYPKKVLTADDSSLQVPYPVICGEAVEYLGKTSDGIVALSNFRLFIRFKEAFLNIPLGIIESVEYRDIFFIHIYCKDAHTFRCKFSTNETCLEWYKRLTKALSPPEKLTSVFAFAFHAWCVDTGSCAKPDQTELQASQLLCRMVDSRGYSFGKEVDRMGFDLKSAWRITHINEEHRCCESYPQFHVVPHSVTDKDLEAVALFRACHRFPSIVWRDQRSGAVIARCSQPEVGWLGWRDAHDEALLHAISVASVLNGGDSCKAKPSSNGDSGVSDSKQELKKLLILDARSYTAAFANRTKGGGCECSEYYPNCEIQFMSLANIHTIRKSFQAVRQLCAQTPDQPGWLTAIENTKWLQHISSLLRTALIVVHAIDIEQRPVLVHCSDGWDRTPQITSLSQLLIDPYYRTAEGFRVLVEREWLAFGHKFADRCGQGLCSEDANERCPVFLQWLDCVHQLVEQFPTAFQFNEAFLVKLVQHTYSNLFGEFLCNTDQERQAANLRSQTSSVWTILCPQNRQFVNLLFKPTAEQVLHPSCHVRHLSLWRAVYLSDSSPTQSADDFLDVTDGDGPLVEEGDESSETALPPKTRSCEDLVSAVEHSSPTMTRRLSDPNIPRDLNDLLNSPEAQDESSVASDGSPNETTDPSNTSIVPDLENTHVRIDKENDSVAFCFGKSRSSETVKASESDSVENVNEVIGEDEVSKQAECSSSVSEDSSSGGEANNGCDSEDETDLVNGLCDESAPINHASNLTNGSTDTLTEVEENSLPVSNSSQNYSINGFLNENCAIQNGHVREEGNGLTDKQRASLLSLEKLAHMSTSTSDISDSHVWQAKTSNGKKPCSSLCRLDDILTLQKVSSTLKDIPNGHCVRRTKESLPNTLVNGMDLDTFSSRGSQTTPGSMSPPTPGESKSHPWLSRQLSNLSKQLDCDGLTSYNDPVQNRLAQIEGEYQQKLLLLERKLQLAQNMLCQYAAGTCNGGGKHDNRDEILSTESADSGEHTSLGGCSTAASDVSWEQVEERDAEMTLWVPDHAVTHCAGCDAEFWIVRRKHHCRSCGQVFCNDCTEFYCAVPQQQLNVPVRVCCKCYESISRESPEILSAAEGASFSFAAPQSI